jgi:hypothetical protein
MVIMKILFAKVNWNKDWKNDPELCLMLDSDPEFSKLIYTSNDRRDMWFAEHEGYVSFLSGHPDRPGSGFGGSTFDLNTTEGSVRLVGPWSSNDGVMNREGFTPSIRALFTANPTAFKRGTTMSVGHITVPLAKQIVGEHLDGIRILRVVNSYWHAQDEFHYVPYWYKNPCKHPGVGRNDRCSRCQHQIYAPVTRTEYELVEEIVTPY